MAKVSVSIPDEVVSAAKAAGINISRLATAALSHELRRQGKIAQLDAHLAQLEAELGPISDEDAREAAAWAARFDDASEASEPTTRRSA